VALRRRRLDNNNSNSSSGSGRSGEDEAVAVAPYPQGQPWRVLWPTPHEDPSRASPLKTRKIPRLSDFQKAWVQYKATWADGIQGVPDILPPTAVVVPENEGKEVIKMENVGENAARNLQLARDEAQQLVQQAQEHTGIKNQEDLRKFAADMMQLATECLKEFMAGYRQGRDEEVDKMLHEYFQEEEQEETPNDDHAPKRRRRRKPKTAVLRE
jgi:hypothetical protein